MRTPLFCLLASFVLLSGCTHYSHRSIPSEPSPDASTPIQYQAHGMTSGYLGQFKGINGKIYNAMTLHWHRQHPEVPTIATRDVYGNTIYAVTDEDLSKWYANQL